MADLLTAPDDTPPAGLPAAGEDDTLRPCHTGAAALGCGACWAILDLLNERARRG